jgi:hypothetical protein
MISSSATCDGNDAPALADPGGGIDPSSPSDILGGESVSWNMAYTVPQGSYELIVTMTYANNDHIYFIGKV